MTSDECPTWTCIGQATTSSFDLSLSSIAIAHLCKETIKEMGYGTVTRLLRIKLSSFSVSHPGASIPYVNDECCLFLLISKILKNFPIIIYFRKFISSPFICVQSHFLT